MTDSDPDPAGQGREWHEIDTTTAHAAREYDHWLGGKANFAADRQAARQAAEANPGIVPAVRANRAFLGRAVRHLVNDAGIRQFLDVGTGIPAENNTHQVAQRAAPECRIVYADSDPIVLAHAHRLLKSTPDGACAYLHADLRDPGRILEEAAATIDLSRPVALMLVAVLQYIPDADDPAGIVARLTAVAAPGSYLVISHPASDIGASEVAESMRRYNQRAAEQATPRTREEVTGFFGGLELLAPGVVQLPEWRPDPGTERPPEPLPMWCGAARKP